MSRPTILIGIGSGGLRSIEAAWKLSQEILSPEDRPNVQYIYLETDGASEPVSSEIVKSPLILNNISTTKHSMEEDINVTSQWINGQVFPSNVFNGAGGSPVLGRMTLWDINNRQTFVNNLLTAQRKLNESSLEQPVVYVVGSFGGGTGSGIFLDVAYMIRDTLRNRVELQGLFMIPNLGLNTQIVYSNSICCLKELDYYNDVNHAFPFKWTANPPKGYEKENTPFDLVQIISSSYGTANIGTGAPSASLSPVTYSQLHDEAGIFLYLNSLGMYDTRRTSLVDHSGAVIASNYTTFGLAAVHYPESDIKEIEGNILAGEFLDKIIDREHYYDTNYRQVRAISQSVNQIRNDVRNSFSSRFADIIKRWCTQISIAQDGQNITVESHLRTLADSLSSSNFSNKEKWDNLYRLFSVGGEYYKQLKNLCPTNATDQVICLIIDEVRNVLNHYHNLHVAEYALDEIEETVKQILSFWRANGYTPVPQDWNQMLKHKLDKEVLPIPFIYKLLSEKQKLYYDRLMYILLYGLALHIFSDNLVRLHRALKGEQDAAGNRIQMVVSTTGVTMPAKWRLSELSKVIENVSSGTDAKYRSCSQVADSLKTKLSRTANGNVWYIYPQGDFGTTLKDIDEHFRTEYGQERSIKDITGNEDLYTFIFSIPRNRIPNDICSEKDLYGKVVPAFISKINLGSFSVSDAINNNNYGDKVKLVATKSLIPHVPTNPPGRNATFVDHQTIPHILGGYDGETGDVLDNISDKLSQLGIHQYVINDANRNKFSHIGLRNWLIFYQEFGRMSDQKGFNPIDDLADFNDYVTCYVADRKISGCTAEEYHGKRMPYISFADCHAQALHYIQEAIDKTKDEEYEEAVKFYTYATYWDMTNETTANKLAEIRSMLAGEDSSSKFERYYAIASRYMKIQDYISAREYYNRADKIQPNDANVLDKIREIDHIYEQVRGLINQGDQLCQSANQFYDAVKLKGDIMKKPDCITAYNTILAYYRQAQKLSKFDNDVKQKIRNIEKKLNNIND